MKRTQYPGRRRSYLYGLVVLWLSILLVMLIWKGAVISETLNVRQFLGMSETYASPVWWLGAGCITASVIAWLGCMLLQLLRGSGRGNSRLYTS